MTRPLATCGVLGAMERGKTDMKGTFEVIAYKDGERTVRHYTVELFNGITDLLYRRMEKMGYSDITVHLMA